MKTALLAILGTLTLALAACQSDMTGATRGPAGDSVLAACPSDQHPDVPVGDAYFEEMIGRYHLSDAK